MSALAPVPVACVTAQSMSKSTQELRENKTNDDVSSASAIRLVHKFDMGRGG